MKKFDISEVIVLIGPCSVGKSTISRELVSSSERLNVDSLISYMGFGDGVEFDDLYYELENYVKDGTYKVYEFGGSTLTMCPQEFQDKVFNLFKGATVLHLRPMRSNLESYNFLKRFILSEKNTLKERKKELLRGVRYDLKSGFFKRFQTEPTIYTLKNITLSPLDSTTTLARKYRSELFKIAEDIKQNINSKNIIRW